jgi:putative transposase
LSEDIQKSHNVSVLMYHFVCPAKYRRAVFSKEVDETLKEVCLEIAKRYEIVFLEIGTDKNVHFLVQSVPRYSPTKIIRTIKSLTAKRNIRKTSRSKEKIIGWGILVRWIFRQYRKQIWQ